MACVMQVKLGAQGFCKFPSDHTTHGHEVLKKKFAQDKGRFYRNPDCTTGVTEKMFSFFKS